MDKQHQQNEKIVLMGEEVERYRILSGVWKWIAFGSGLATIIIAIFQLFGFAIGGYRMHEIGFLGILIALLLPLSFVFFPATKRAPRDSVPWYDSVIAAISFIGPFYIFVFAKTILSNAWSIEVPWHTFVLGLPTVLLLFEASRRIGGNWTMGIVIVFGAYPLFAYYMPGWLMGNQYGLARIIGFHFASESSIFGEITSVFAKTILGFLVFGSVLMAMGAGRFFMNFGLPLVGWVRGGAAKLSIITSAMFGMMSGSAMSNAATTGSFTIPLMKNLGYKSEYAAAVEACSATGGVITPPVMGAIAFIMAEFLQISYADVCIAAGIPAILYYIAIYIQTDLQAVKSGLKGLPRNELPSFLGSLKIGWHIIIGLAVLVHYLFTERAVGESPFYASLAVFIFGMFMRQTRLNRRSFQDLIIGNARVMAEVGVLMAGMGMILGSLALTGVGQGFASGVTSLAGQNELLLLVLTAIASFIMGLGMSVAACYIFLAILVAPALVHMGANPVAAHLFMLFWGIASYITPPVALSVLVAAGIAHADAWKAGWLACRLGFMCYFVPFLFVYNIALVGIGDLSRIVLSIVMAVLAIISVSSGLEGYIYGIGAIGWPLRIAVIAIGIPQTLGVAWYRIDLAAVGLGLFVVLIFVCRLFRRKKARTVPVS